MTHENNSPFAVQTGNFDINDAPSYELMVYCMRCGLCLSACPTFSIFHLEKTSPRGRLAMMRAVSEGRMDVTPGFDEAMNLCLGCLACQSACPAGVNFGGLLEKARQQAEYVNKKKRPALLNWFRQLILTRLVSGPHDLEFLMPLLRLYQKIGMAKLNLARLIPGPLGKWERMLPELPPKSVHKTLGDRLPAVPPVRGKVGLLTGCLENTLLADMCIATARVLAHNGFEVVMPPEQVCCGAIPGHIGELDLARQRARENIDAFENAGVEIVISDAAGCSAQLKEYGHLLADDPEYSERAARFSANAMDANEFLAAHLPLREGMEPLNVRVTYDDPCHLVHGQGVSAEPRQLLKAIPGLEFVELPESTWCCGSGGTYNLTHTEESMQLLKRKMDNVRSVNPQVLTTSNTGCYIQLKSGAKQFGVDVEVLHVMQLIARAYGLA